VSFDRGPQDKGTLPGEWNVPHKTFIEYTVDSQVVGEMAVAKGPTASACAAPIQAQPDIKSKR
jgi:hypothetical protein